MKKRSYFEPWIVLKQRNGLGETLIAPAKGTPLIAVCCGADQDAAARLVAAAPELLASLKFATKWLRNVARAEYLPQSLKDEAAVSVKEWTALLGRIEKGRK